MKLLMMWIGVYTTSFFITQNFRVRYLAYSIDTIGFSAEII